MPIVWPANLPYEPHREGWEIPNRSQPLLQSEMQSGKIRQRRPFTVRIVPMNWTRFYSPAELGVFEAFLLNDLQEGSAEFTMPIWNAATQTYVQRTVQINGGAAGVAITEEDFEIYRVRMVLNVQGL